MGKVKKKPRASAKRNSRGLHASQPTKKINIRSWKSPPSTVSTKKQGSLKQSVFDDLKLNTQEMEEELESAVIKQLRGHKEWLLSRRSKKKKITSPATAESDKNNNKKTNFLAILESLGEDAGNKMDEDAPKDVAKDVTKDFAKDVAAAAGEKEEEEEEDDFDSRSAITNKGLRGVCVKKEQRKKLKKQLWLKKIALTEKHLSKHRREVSVKGKAPPPLFNDLSCMSQSLSTIKWVNEGHRSRAGGKIKRIGKRKAIEEARKSDLSSFAYSSATDAPSDDNPFNATKLKLLQKFYPKNG